MRPSDTKQKDADEAPALRCVNHRGTETYLLCGKCGLPICARCVVMTPLGAWCWACARPRRLLAFEVTPLYYLRAIGAALAAAFVGGALAGYVRLALPIVSLLLPLALGYLVGEAVSRAVNRKRGGPLKVIAGAGVVVAVVLQQVVAIFAQMPALLSLVGLWQISAGSLLNVLASPMGLVVVALAVLVAVSRL